jgi:hypothetical protein
MEHFGKALFDRLISRRRVLIAEGYVNWMNARVEYEVASYGLKNAQRELVNAVTSTRETGDGALGTGYAILQSAPDTTSLAKIKS